MWVRKEGESIEWEQETRLAEHGKVEFFNPELRTRWQTTPYVPVRYMDPITGKWSTEVPRSVRDYFANNPEELVIPPVGSVITDCDVPSWNGATVVDVIRTTLKIALDGNTTLLDARNVRGFTRPPPLETPAPQKEGVGSTNPGDQTLFTGQCPPGTKADSGKTIWRYMPFKALEHVAKVLEYGAKKYAPDNWKTLQDGKMRYFDAAMRHLTEWKESGPYDNGEGGSGLRHLAHAACCCLFTLWFEDQELRQNKDENGKVE